MERLTAKAYNEYDGAARAHMVARLLQESVAVPPGSTPSEHCSAVLICLGPCMQPRAMVKRHVELGCYRRLWLCHPAARQVSTALLFPCEYSCPGPCINACNQV